MHRLFSAFLIATFLSQVIGFGWPVFWPVSSEGDFSKLLPKADKSFSSVKLPAVLSRSSSQPDYGSLVMVGDVLLARNVEYLMRTEGGNYPFAGVEVQSFGQMAAVVGNFEASIPKEHTPTPIGMLNFSVPTTSIPHLEKAGFTHLSLANNHSYDYEEEGLSHTITTLTPFTKPFGNPNSIDVSTYEIVEVDNQSVALIGINGLLPINDDDLHRLFKKLSKQTDFQLVYIHWGEEYALRHNTHQKTTAEKLIEYGADLVVGHHPHVVQGVDLIEDVPVFYSLGNYIFDQYFSKDVQEGLVISLDLKDGLDISLIPVTSKTTLSQPNLMPDKSHANWLKSLARKSHPQLKEGIESGRINLSEEIATLDKVAIIHDTEAYVQ